MTKDVLMWAAGMVLAAIVSYFTAAAAINVRIEHIDTRESEHYRQLSEGMSALKVEVSGARSDFQGVRLELMRLVVSHEVHRATTSGASTPEAEEEDR